MGAVKGFLSRPPRLAEVAMDCGQRELHVSVVVLVRAEPLPILAPLEVALLHPEQRTRFVEEDGSLWLFGCRVPAPGGTQREEMCPEESFQAGRVAVERHRGLRREGVHEPRIGPQRVEGGH